MSVDKLVDSTLLDAACTYEAGKIREKLGSSAQIAYDLANGKGFGDAIAAIPSGGGDNLPDFLANELSVISVDGLTRLKKSYAFRGSPATKISLNDMTAFDAGLNVFQDCTSLTVVSMPKVATYSQNPSSTFGACKELIAIDLNKWRFGGNDCSGCTKLATIIMRSTSINALASTNAFTNTPFASGGAGGTIYILKSLYDHLGDNSSSDYKAATNWSTINGYGTITWAKIEGSYYETHYADGTLIPT